MLKNFYFSLTPAHQDMILEALVSLGFIAGLAVIGLIFAIIFRLLYEWFFLMRGEKYGKLERNQ